MKIETATIQRLSEALLQSGRRPSMVISSAYETLTREGLLSPEELAALSRVDPLAETMFLMMSADGKITDEEQDAVRGAIRGLTDNLLRSGTIKVMMENYNGRLEEDGKDEGGKDDQDAKKSTDELQDKAKDLTNSLFGGKKKKDDE